MLLISAAQSSNAATWIVETTHQLSTQETKTLEFVTKGSLSKFSHYQSGRFSKIYSLETEIPRTEIERLSVIKTVEDVVAISSQSITPSGTKPTIGTDPLIPYQWGLENTGQVAHYDLDDITVRTREGIQGVDIGLSGAQQAISKLKRTTIVAVIDSGVDIDHPELKNQIFTNESECIKGEIPLRPTEDKDGNGLLGDCKGWDFTGKNKDGSPRQIDDIGHGTHIAGIIAATSEDGVGIRGLSNQIRILPIKVLSTDSERKNAIGLSDRMARAILYAVQMRADVINLSLGWPLFLDRVHLREAIEEAKKAGVLIVAAAGNNNHGAPLLPCAISGVLCVGSINNDGRPSDFSNFGAHVDILAPGDQILSTIPRALKSMHFPALGYDYKSGTSQAAPLVAGAAAILKGLNPELTAQDVYARLIATSVPLPDMGNSYAHDQKPKAFRAGRIHLGHAIQNKINYPLTIQLKDADRNLIWSNLNRTVRIQLPIFNGTTKPATGSVQLQLSKDFSVQNNTVQFSAQPGQTFRAEFEVQILSAETDRNLQADALITFAGQKSRHHADYELLRRLDPEKETERFPIADFKGESLFTLKRFGRAAASPRYLESTAEKGVATLRIFGERNGEYRPLDTFQIPGAERVLQTRELDVDGDGDLDLQAVALMSPAAQGADKTIRYWHFPLAGDNRNRSLFQGDDRFASIELQVEGVLEIETELQHVLFPSQDGNPPFRAPVFVATGRVPTSDQPKDPFSRRVTTESQHLYYFSPVQKNGAATQIVLETRIVDSPDRLRKWHRELGLKPFEDIRFLNILPSSTESEIHALASIGQNYSRTTYAVRLTLSANDVSAAWSPIGDNLVLDGYALDRTIDLGNPLSTDFALVGQISDTKWVKATVTDNTLLPHHLVSPDPTELINTFIQSYRQNDLGYSFLQTVSEILFTVERPNGATIAHRIPFHVTTFLPGQTFQERAWALWYGSGDQRKSALYVDASQILTRSAYLIVGDESGLSTPAHMSVEIPKECMANNPSLWNEDEYRFSFVCKTSAGFEMRFLPMR